MHHLVPRHQPHALSRREGLEHKIERLNPNLNEIDGYGSRATISGVIKVLDEDGDLALRLVAELLFVEVRRVLQGANQQRSKILMLRGVVDDSEVFRLLAVQTWLSTCT